MMKINKNIVSIIKNKNFYILLLFVLLIILIRIPFLSNPGLGYDMGYWFGWTKSIKDFGLVNVYEQFYTDYVNYPPMMMYIFWVISKVYTFMGGSWESPETLFYILIKIPAIIFDILLSLFIFYVAKKDFKFNFSKSLLISAAFAFNPFVIYNSVIWAQVDSIHSFFMVFAIYLLTKKKYKWVWIITGVTLLIKLQFIAIIPLIGFVTLYQVKLLKTIQYIIYSILTFLLGGSIYFLQGKLLVVIEMYINTISSNGWAFEFGAFNIWRIYSYSFLKNLELQTSQISFFVNLVYFLFIIAVLYLNFKNLVSQKIYMIAAWLCFVFFMIPIGVHERYLYPFFPFLIVLSMKNKRYWLLYIFMSFIFLVNMDKILRYIKFFDIIQYDWIGVVLGIINLFLFIIFTYLTVRPFKKYNFREILNFR